MDIKQQNNDELLGLLPAYTEKKKAIFNNTNKYKASLIAQLVRICLQCRRPWLDSWVGKIPLRRKWQPTAVFLPGKSQTDL